MFKLDTKDRRILWELDVNSRQSYHRIAKKVELSRDSVIYRMRKLEAEGIIRKYRAIVNVGKLGYISFRLYLKLQNATPSMESEIIEYLKSKSIVCWIVSVDGIYDLNMWIVVKTVKQMNEFWKEFLSLYVNYVSKRWLTIFTKVSYFSRPYLLNRKVNELSTVFITEPELSAISSSDLKIISILVENARASLVEISSKTGLSVKSVAKHIKILENNQVIVGYRTDFNMGKLNYLHFKLHIMLHNVSEQKLSSLKQYIFIHPNIVFDNEVLGGDDIEIEIQTNSLNSFKEIVDDIKSRFSDIILNYYYLVYFKEHKFLSLPFENEDTGVGA